MRRREWLALLLLAAASPPVAGDDVVRKVGRVIFRVDTRYAHPGGLLLARASSSARLGGVSVLLAGRRVPLMPAGGVLRALVPVPLTLAPGPLTLGFEVSSRTGRQRIPVEIATLPHDYPARSVSLPPSKLGLLASRQTLFDGRRVLQALRETALQPVHLGPLRPLSWDEAVRLLQATREQLMSALISVSSYPAEMWTDAHPFGAMLRALPVHDRHHAEQIKKARIEG